MLLLLVGIACSPTKEGSVNTFDDSAGTAVCIDPTVVIVSPAVGGTFNLGDTVAFTGTFESAVETDATDMSPLWAVDGVVIGAGLNETWIADAPGERLVELQVEDRCGVGRASALVTIIGKVGG